MWFMRGDSLVNSHFEWIFLVHGLVFSACLVRIISVTMTISAHRRIVKTSKCPCVLSATRQLHQSIVIYRQTVWSPITSIEIVNLIQPWRNVRRFIPTNVRTAHASSVKWFKWNVRNACKPFVWNIVLPMITNVKDSKIPVEQLIEQGKSTRPNESTDVLISSRWSFVVLQQSNEWTSKVLWWPIKLSRIMPRHQS